MLWQGIQASQRLGRVVTVTHSPSTDGTHATGAGTGTPTEGAAGAAGGALTIRARAKGVGVLQLMTKTVDADFIIAMFRVKVPAASASRGAGAQRAAALALVSRSMVVGGFSHHDVALLQPSTNGSGATNTSTNTNTNTSNANANADSSTAGSESNAPRATRPRSRSVTSSHGVSGGGGIVGLVDLLPSSMQSGNSEPLLRVKLLRRRVSGSLSAALRSHVEWTAVPLDNLTTCMRE